MKLAICVSDATHLVCAGGELVKTTRLFVLPEEISNYISKQKGPYLSISLGLEDAAIDQE